MSENQWVMLIVAATCVVNLGVLVMMQFMNLRVSRLERETWIRRFERGEK